MLNGQLRRNSGLTIYHHHHHVNFVIFDGFDEQQACYRRRPCTCRYRRL